MRWIAFLISLAILGCEEKTSLPYYNSPSFDPIFISDPSTVNSVVQHHIGDFSFVDQDGKIFTHKEVEGNVHVANFFFTSCISICPKMTGNMAKVANAFRGSSDVIILSYSVTPWIDSVARLKEYANSHNIPANWHLLTGNRGQIYELARRSYFAEEDLGFTRDSTEFLHTEHFILIDRDKRIRGIYNGTLLLEIEQLIQDIDALRKE